MSCLLSIKDKDKNFKHYEVPEEVYIYVQQLEMFIKFPNDSKLLEAYPERFAVGTNRLLCGNKRTIWRKRKNITVKQWVNRTVKNLAGILNFAIKNSLGKANLDDNYKMFKHK
jgi:hypothetical protein